MHLCLDSDQSSFRLTLPAILGEEAIIELVEAFHGAALNAVRRQSSGVDANLVDAIAQAWPEHVLGPGNPLTFL